MQKFWIVHCDLLTFWVVVIPYHLFKECSWMACLCSGITYFVLPIMLPKWSSCYCIFVRCYKWKLSVLAFGQIYLLRSVFQWLCLRSLMLKKVWIRHNKMMKIRDWLRFIFLGHQIKRAKKWLSLGHRTDKKGQNPANLFSMNRTWWCFIVI